MHPVVTRSSSFFELGAAQNVHILFVGVSSEFLSFSSHMLFLVAVFSLLLVPTTSDLQDLVNNRMFSCIADVEFCRAHSPNLKLNIWNHVFSKLYTRLDELLRPGPSSEMENKEEEREEENMEDEGVVVEVYDSENKVFKLRATFDLRPILLN